jgi:hypothetical protein
VSPVRYELDLYVPEDDFFIATVVKTSNLTPTNFVLRYHIKQLFTLQKTTGNR